jgi:hypothetical protein
MELLFRVPLEVGLNLRWNSEDVQLSRVICHLAAASLWPTRSRFRQIGNHVDGLYRKNDN